MKDFSSVLNANVWVLYNNIQCVLAQNSSHSFKHSKACFALSEGPDRPMITEHFDWRPANERFNLVYQTDVT